MAYQSLYRRYRPARFAEVRGQEHLVAALRNAVRDDRVGHAYLFSGPRGTGKTSTARILAKVLNCEAPIDGEPCCECASCLAIEAGTSFDVHELDAASNNGVEAVRDLIARASLGTPGRTKVYILDEVHMLTTAASNALLKTLEEPPPNVVFVLATTDPQKVLPTIRSRTQHFEVHLLSSADLEGLVDFVVDDAGLDVSLESRAYVLRVGGGSARDTLSALDRVVAAGGVPEGDDAIDELVEALCDHDTGRALVAVDGALSRGRAPRVLGEMLIARLRDVFLAAMGNELSRLTDTDRARAIEQARRLGAAGATRSLEVLGEALVGIHDALDPRIPLEVALVRLTRIDTDTSLDALAARVARLEQGGVPATTTPAPAAPVASPTAAPSPDDARVPASATLAAPPGVGGGRPADAARDALRARAGSGETRPTSSAPSRAAARPGRPARSSDAATADAATPAPAAPAAPDPSDDTPARADTAAPRTAPGTSPTLTDLGRVWTDTLLPTLPQKARARFAGGHWVSVDDGTAVFGLPNEPHAQRCEEFRPQLESSLAAHFGTPVPVRLVVDGSAPDPSAPRAVAASRRATADPIDDVVDPDELTDATGVNSAGVERIAAIFPGAELVDGE